MSLQTLSLAIASPGERTVRRPSREYCQPSVFQKNSCYTITLHHYNVVSHGSYCKICIPFFFSFSFRLHLVTKKRITREIFFILLYVSS